MPKRTEMAAPVPTKAFLQATPDTAMLILKALFWAKSPELILTKFSRYTV